MDDQDEHSIYRSNCELEFSTPTVKDTISLIYMFIEMEE
jgi:hypothetical protein